MDIVFAISEIEELVKTGGLADVGKALPLALKSLGENITTSGVDLEHLPAGTRMRFHSGAEILLTGLRKPCHQVDKFSKGLLKLTVADPKNCSVPYKIGVMGVVVVAGGVSSDDEIKLIFPPVPHEPMTKV